MVMMMIQTPMMQAIALKAISVVATPTLQLAIAPPSPGGARQPATKCLSIARPKSSPRTERVADIKPVNNMICRPASDIRDQSQEMPGSTSRLTDLEPEKSEVNLAAKIAKWRVGSHLLARYLQWEQSTSRIEMRRECRGAMNYRSGLVPRVPYLPETGVPLSLVMVGEQQLKEDPTPETAKVKPAARTSSRGVGYPCLHPLRIQWESIWME